MVRHPKPSVIAKQLRHLADTLDDEGDRAITRAAVLAARGYPASSGGSGVRGGKADSTSTERAAGLSGDGKETDPPLNLTPPMFAGLDDKLAKLLRTLFHAALRIDQTIAHINAHAPDDDALPAGTGFCQACDLFVRPTRKRPGFRLKSGLCPGDYSAFYRWRRACTDTGHNVTVGDFVYARWVQRNPEGTTEQYLAWRKQKLDAA